MHGPITNLQLNDASVLDSIMLRWILAISPQTPQLPGGMALGSADHQRCAYLNPALSRYGSGTSVQAFCQSGINHELPIVFTGSNILDIPGKRGVSKVGIKKTVLRVA